MSHKLATVVFTNEPICSYEVSYRKTYAYIIEDDLQEGDMVESPDYDNKMMVVRVFENDEPYYKGIKLKTLNAYKINGIKVEKMEKKNMFSGIFFLTKIKIYIFGS